MILLLIFIPTALILAYASIRLNASESLIKASEADVQKTETIKEILLNIIKVIGILSFVPFLAPYAPAVTDFLSYINLNIDTVYTSVVLIWNILLALWAKLRMISSSAAARSRSITDDNLTSSL
jgi:hypothetical protein